MEKRATLSSQTRTNLLVDTALFAVALVSALSGIYFLFLPNGGYEGGRNATYGVTFLFNRATWADLHTWGGVAMIVMAMIHFVLHWSWITMMTKRIVGKGRISAGARRNLVINFIVATSFLVTAVSGLYMLFTPNGGHHGGRNAHWDPGFLWSRSTWELIHMWAGTLLIIAAVIHFVIHWRWIKNVGKRFISSLGAEEPVPQIDAP